MMKHSAVVVLGVFAMIAYFGSLNAGTSDTKEYVVKSAQATAGFSTFYDMAMFMAACEDDDAQFTFGDITYDVWNNESKLYQVKITATHKVLRKEPLQ